MAQKRDGRLTISAMPWKDSLLTAGRQATIAETGLWEAANVTAELDGLLSKRPGLLQWGQILNTPDADATDSSLTSFVDFLIGLAGFTETDSSAGLITNSVAQGALHTNVRAGSSNESLTESYAVSALSANAFWSSSLASPPMT